MEFTVSFLFLFLPSIVEPQQGIIDNAVSSPFSSAFLHHDHIRNDFGCDCMEYWTCVMSGGTPYSYCPTGELCCITPLNASPLSLSTLRRKGENCGRKGRNSGRQGKAEMAEWPWHGAILEKPEDLYVCGASLLRKRWVLTAAHCVDDYLVRVQPPSEVLKVRLGEYDVSSTSEPFRHEEFDVLRVILHPGFENTTLVHDIALVQLARPATRRSHIDVVCMPQDGQGVQEPGTTCYVTGWGRVTENSPHSVVLKEISVPLWEHGNCERVLKQQFGPTYTLPNTSICAGQEGSDACDGDGGGPLVCEKDGHWYQMGIVSFGIGCGRRNIPGVYTRVDKYYSWIKQTIQEYDALL